MAKLPPKPPKKRNLPPKPPKKRNLPPKPPKKRNLPPKPPKKRKDVLFDSDGRLLEENLHDYQLRCLKHMSCNPHSMIWAFLASGKTLISLTNFVNKQRAGEDVQMLMVSTLKICQLTWEREALKWSHTKHLKFSNMTSPTAKVRQRALFRKADIYLINFESLTWLSKQLKTYFIDQGYDMPFNMLVIDEISKMKNIKSVRFENFTPILDKFLYRIGLTGTPSSNGYQDTYGQFYCIDLGKSLGKGSSGDLYKDAKAGYGQFISRFFYAGSGMYSKPEPFNDTLDMIVECVNDITFIIDARDTNVVLPELVFVDHIVTMPPRAMRIYNDLERDFLVELENGVDLSVENQVTLNMKLAQMASGRVYNYADDEKTIRNIEEIHDKKFEALTEILEEAQDEQALIVYNYQSERDRIMEEHPSAECLSGKSEQESIDIINRFRSGHLQYLIFHPASAAHGVDGLQDNCNLLIQFGLSQNLEFNDQTIGRLQRQNAKGNNVRVIRILCQDTFDFMIKDNLYKKGEAQGNLRKAMIQYKLDKYGE